MLNPNPQQNSLGISPQDTPLANVHPAQGDANATAVADAAVDCAFVEANLAAYLDAELAPRPHKIGRAHV